VGRSAAGVRRSADDRSTSAAPPGSATTGSVRTGAEKAGAGTGVESPGAMGASAVAAAGAAAGGAGAVADVPGAGRSCDPDALSPAVGSIPSSDATTRASGAVAATGAAGAATVLASAAGVVVVRVVVVGVPGAGAATGAAGAGRNESGSRYPCGSEVTRTPMYRYGASSSGVPLGPTVPTASPSPMLAPFFTALVPRCVSVTECPSPVAIVTLSPLVGTLPANVTVPDTGATTVVPASEPMSMPRCCPPAYAWSRSNE